MPKVIKSQFKSQDQEQALGEWVGMTDFDSQHFHTMKTKKDKP